MKVFVFAYQLVVSGPSLNAIELAAAMRDLHGHDVVLFAGPGPMLPLVREKGLRFLPAPEVRFCPSATRARALRDAVRREAPDLIHVWDWCQCIDAYYAVHLPMRIPMIVSDMCMSLTRMLPKGLPTTFGTPELVDRARAEGRARVELIPPPVDARLNAPNVADPEPFRRRYGIRSGDITIVTVSRLDDWMKSESLFRTVDAVRRLDQELRLRLVIVGNGSAAGKLARLAETVNAELGRPAITLTGAFIDPRPAYAAADIVVGMGGAALRGMAFAKPVVIVGERGFSAPLAPETAASFYYKGLYGVGDGAAGNDRLTSQIGALARNRELIRTLGEFSREFVIRQFSLAAVSGRLAKFCEDAASELPSFCASAVDGVRTAAIYMRERRFLPPAGMRKKACTS